MTLLYWAATCVCYSSVVDVPAILLPMVIAPNMPGSQLGLSRLSVTYRTCSLPWLVNQCVLSRKEEMQQMMLPQSWTA